MTDRFGKSQEKDNKALTCGKKATVASRAAGAIAETMDAPLTLFDPKALSGPIKGKQGNARFVQNAIRFTAFSAARDIRFSVEPMRPNEMRRSASRHNAMRYLSMKSPQRSTALWLPQGMIGTVDVEFFGEPSISLSE